jgi:hypothetical protein
MMPTKTSVGPNEVVRLEVLRLAPPLLYSKNSDPAAEVGMALFTTALDLYGGVLWSGELQGFIIHERVPTAAAVAVAAGAQRPAPDAAAAAATATVTGNRQRQLDT